LTFNDHNWDVVVLKMKKKPHTQFGIISFYVCFFMQHIMTGVCMYFMLYSAGSFTFFFLELGKVCLIGRKKNQTIFIWCEIKGR